MKVHVSCDQTTYTYNAQTKSFDGSGVNKPQVKFSGDEVLITVGSKTITLAKSKFESASDIFIPANTKFDQKVHLFKAGQKKQLSDYKKALCANIRKDLPNTTETDMTEYYMAIKNLFTNKDAFRTFVEKFESKIKVGNREKMLRAVCVKLWSKKLKGLIADSILSKYQDLNSPDVYNRFVKELAGLAKDTVEFDSVSTAGEIDVAVGELVDELSITLRVELKVWSEAARAALAPLAPQNKLDKFVEQTKKNNSHEESIRIFKGATLKGWLVSLKSKSEISSTKIDANQPDKYFGILAEAIHKQAGAQVPADKAKITPWAVQALVDKLLNPKAVAVKPDITVTTEKEITMTEINKHVSELKKAGVKTGEIKDGASFMSLLSKLRDKLKVNRPEGKVGDPKSVAAAVDGILKGSAVHLKKTLDQILLVFSDDFSTVLASIGNDNKVSATINVKEEKSHVPYAESLKKLLKIDFGEKLFNLDTLLNYHAISFVEAPKTEVVVPTTSPVKDWATTEVINGYIDKLKAAGLVAIKDGERVPYGETVIKDKDSLIKKLTSMVAEFRKRKVLIDVPSTWTADTAKQLVKTLVAEAAILTQKLLLEKLKKADYITNVTLNDGKYKIVIDADKILESERFRTTLSNSFLSTFPVALFDSSHVLKNTKLWIAVDNDKDHKIDGIRKSLGTHITVKSAADIAVTDRVAAIAAEMTELEKFFWEAVKRKDYVTAKTALDAYNAKLPGLGGTDKIAANTVGAKMQAEYDKYLKSLKGNYLKNVEDVGRKLKPLSYSGANIGYWRADDDRKMGGKKITATFYYGTGDNKAITTLIRRLQGTKIKYLAIYHGNKDPKINADYIKSWGKEYGIKVVSEEKVGGAFDQDNFAYIIVPMGMPHFGNRTVSDTKRALTVRLQNETE